MGPYIGPGPESEGAVTLRLAGAALYGPSWQTALAAALEPHHPNKRTVNVVLVKRWNSGDRSIPGWVWPAIEEIAEQRRRDLEDAMIEVVRMKSTNPDTTYRQNY